LHKGNNGWPTATLKKFWGDIYQGKKNAPQAGELWTHGLRWEEAAKSIWWSYGHKYAVSPETHPSFGRTVLNDANGTFAANGPYTLSTQHSNRTRTGTTRLPQWFADKYTGGKTLAVGVGGCAAGVATASMGLHLSVISEPNPGGAQTLAGKTIIDYPYSEFQNGSAYNRPEFLCRRDPGYIAKSAPLGLPGGYWTAGDMVGGCEYISVGGKHGFVVCGSLVDGTIDYPLGGTTITSRKPVLFIYNPDDLGKAALGQIALHSIVPVQIDLDCFPRIKHLHWLSGMAFDPVESRLYLVDCRAWDTGFDQAPLVHVYEVK
jgi:hypothetical protein